MTCAFADPKEWLLKVTPTIQSQLWQRSQGYATPSSRWRAYMNQICLCGFLSWVKNEYSLRASTWYSAPSIPAFWEFVNGTGVLLGNRRVILLPSEAIDDRELEVPQEWVDLPGWAGDFYLPVQVKDDGKWVRFWGYTTHQELKTLAQYDPVDRTYSIDGEDLTKDLNAFWMAYQFCQQEELKTAVSPLPELSTTQAENMVQRLGRSSVRFPRLEVPFTTWGSLLEKEQWRKALYQQRQQPQQMQAPQVVNLSAWVQGIYETSWQAIETFFNSNTNSLAFNFRSSPGSSVETIRRAKVIDLGVQAGVQAESEKVALLVALTPQANQQMSVRVQLHPVNSEYLPNNIKLVLLSESGEIIQEVQGRTEDSYIQLKLFEGEVGECFNIQITLGHYQVRENFVV